MKKLTKESLKNKPFCLVLGKDWTLRPSKTDLRQIYTDLSWTRKHRKAYTVEQEDLKNITQILSEEQLGEDGPVRILVQGKVAEKALIFMAFARKCMVDKLEST